MNLKAFAIAAIAVTGVSGAAMAQYYPAPGGYSNPASGAVNGEASGAASGYATGGPVGAVVGGAVGTAAGAVTGATNTATGVVGAATAPLSGGGCAPGYYFASNGYCYPNR